ncbi:hypothetical protein V5O48_019660, partial [Marasmius crinis-equi]
MSQSGSNKRKLGEEESVPVPGTSSKAPQLRRQRTEGVDVGNVVTEKRKRKDSEKMKDGETKKPKKTSKPKDPVDSAKNMKGLLLKNGVDVREKATLKKPKK